jgi:hypothetical protein
MAKSKSPQPSKRVSRTPAKPPPVPPARISIQLDNARLVAESGGELVFSNADASAFVDAKRWPPRVVVHRGQHVRYAARSDSGWWIVYTPRDPATWVLRTFPKISAEAHTSEEPEPVPARDLTPFYADLDEARRNAELANRARIEGLDVCYELVVVVPRHVGLGEQRRPYVRRGRNWAEDMSLPPLDKPLADVCTTHPTRSGERDEGTWVMLWNDHLYVPLATFVELYPATVSSGGYAPVSAPNEGVFALQDTRLVEVHIDSVREHLPGMKIVRFVRGPGTTLVVETEAGSLLYDHVANEVAELGALVGDSQIVGVTKAGALILFDPRAGDLRRLMPRQLAKLPRRRADAAPEASPEAPVAVLDALGAASRPTIAAAGDLVVIVTEDAVRFWNLDIPLAKTEVPAIAVGLRGRQAAVLDARGLLHEMRADTTTVSLFRSRPVLDHPRSLAPAHADHWIVIGKDSVMVVGTEQVRIDVAGAIAAAADPDGAIVIVAEGRRLALFERGELFDIPESAEQLVSIAPLGGRRFICAGERNLFVLDLAQRELEALYEQNATPFIAVSPNGKLVAFATSSSVTVASITGTTLAEIESAHYPETYTEPADEPMFVCGLAFLDDERVGVALTKGRGNVLDVVRKTTKKFDPHPGDTRTRWLFTFATKILVAEDP